MAVSFSRHQQTHSYRRGWLFERVGWLVIAAVVIGAAGGAFGNGWLSSAEVSAGGLVARYSRFGRVNAPLALEVEWSPQRGEAALWIARSYIDEFAIEEVRPSPSATTIDSQRIYYTFAARAPTAPVTVAFRLRAEHGGRLRGVLGLDDGPELELRQFIFP